MAEFQIIAEWDDGKAQANAAKHGVSFELAVTVLYDPLSITTFDAEHSGGEERWMTIGRAANGQLIVIVHTWTEISADAPAFA